MNLFNKLKEMKMMLIDDDEWIRSSLSLFFEGEGIELSALETAEEALEELQQNPYDIIIVDYRLPGISGLEFLKRIHETHPHAIKILITAYKDKKLISEALSIGVQDFIEKPFSTSTIEQTLSWVISDRLLSQDQHLSRVKN
jgi:two-component system response regulator (stage 0 sporulation protein F)